VSACDPFNSIRDEGIELVFHCHSCRYALMALMASDMPTASVLGPEPAPIDIFPVSVLHGSGSCHISLGSGSGSYLYITWQWWCVMVLYISASEERNRQAVNFMLLQFSSFSGCLNFNALINFFSFDSLICLRKTF
jgi:hypothetical protein